MMDGEIDEVRASEYIERLGEVRHALGTWPWPCHSFVSAKFKLRREVSTDLEYHMQSCFFYGTHRDNNSKALET
jgi:hypothetical protein